MKIWRISLYGALLIFGFGSIALGQLPDPKEILLKSKAAIQQIHAISYCAEYYIVGTLRYGEIDAILSPSQGDVMFVRVPEDKFFGGKLIFQDGKSLAESSGSRPFFKVVYDGQKVKKLSQKEKTVFVNDPDQAGKYLLHDIFNLVPNEFKEASPFDDLLKAEKIKYAGKAVVGGVSCHIIQMEFFGDSFPKECWWFLGTDDYIPRKIQRGGYGLPNQEIMQVLTLTNVKIDPAVDRSQFTVEAPEGFSVKKHELSGKPVPTLEAGSMAPNWSLKDPKNKQYSLRDFQGKVIFLDFWATWCGPCRQVMPALQKLQEKYGKNEVIIAGINTWESGDPIKYMQENGYSYLLLLNGDEVAKIYRVSGIPTLYVIGPDGKILYGEVGFEGNTEQFYSKLEQIIVSNLKKK
jgi:thiol-disulfide isomerase/thioredoxin